MSVSQSPASAENKIEGTAPVDPIYWLRSRLAEPVEWWYYNGHLTSDLGEFSFHVAFFRFAAGGFTIGNWIPLHFFTRQVGFAHASVSCLTRKRTWFAQNRNLMWKNVPSQAGLDVHLGQWRLLGDGEEQSLTVDLGGCALQLHFQKGKPLVVFNHVMEPAFERRSSHCCFPRMSVSGSILWLDATAEVHGSAWMDREFGAIGPDQTVADWIWMSVQLDDGSEWMFYRLTHRDGKQDCLKCARIAPSGQVEGIPQESVTMRPARQWTSRHSGAQYPVAWHIASAEFDLDLTVDAVHDDCEFDTRGTTSTMYWEGAAKVRGSVSNASVQGQAFMEIVGRTPRPMLGCMDRSHRRLPLMGYLRNEIHYRIGGGRHSQLQHGELR